MIVKTLSKCIREYKKESILTPVYMAGEVFMEVAITYVLSLLIDRGITPGNMGEILRIGGLLILCALVSLAFGVMSPFPLRLSPVLRKNFKDFCEGLKAIGGHILSIDYFPIFDCYYSLSRRHLQARWTGYNTILSYPMEQPPTALYGRIQPPNSQS